MFVYQAMDSNGVWLPLVETANIGSYRRIHKSVFLCRSPEDGRLIAYVVCITPQNPSRAVTFSSAIKDMLCSFYNRTVSVSASLCSHQSDRQCKRLCPHARSRPRPEKFLSGSTAAPFLRY
jgi:hypothetical protein